MRGNYGRRFFSKKFKTLGELKKIVGKFPREQKVIMCHGTFDIVHPGHIRHLAYTKTKANILVASITADKHVVKANLRPFIPEKLRALNLAALTFVDYVIIDDNPTPIESLNQLQPEIFAKGYEYNPENKNEKTEEEIKVVENYGGQVLFTPGDIVYSSSSIIEESPPQIAAEKAQVVMQGDDISFDYLEQILNSMSEKKVHIVGDTIVDTLSYCNVIGGMTKTPTISVKLNERKDYVGGAAIVAKHLAAAGADVRFTTILGNDDHGKFVINDLENFGIDCNFIIDETRPTTNKNAIVSGGYRLLKIDTVDNRAISGKVLDKISDEIKSSHADATIFSDFRHGIFNKETIPLLTDALPKEHVKVADSQVASRWGNILDFRNFDLLTPNEREVRFALADQDSVIRPLALELMKQTNCKTLILKCAERGIITYRKNSYTDLRAFYALDSFSRKDRVIDPVGAGDYSSCVCYFSVSCFR